MITARALIWPGAAAMRSATSAWTITTRREANGGPTDRRWRSAGGVMWDGRLAATTQPRARLLGPGTPAAPDEHSLLLLPSGSDRVRRSSPRRTRPSTLRCPLSGDQRTTSNGTSTPLERVSGYNGPLLRRLARPRQFYPAHGVIHQFACGPQDRCWLSR